jgi:hypothetical protein
MVSAFEVPTQVNIAMATIVTQARKQVAFF